VVETRSRVERAREVSTKVRAELRGAKQEHRVMLERNREELAMLQRAAAGAGAGRVERFAAVVSHELRQPLNAAMAAAQLVEVGANPSRAIAILQRQLRHMTGLLETLMDVSRVSMKTIDLDLRRIQIRGVLERALETIESAVAAKHLSLTITDCPPELDVFADSRRLSQVFGNLLSNAVRYTPSGGRVDVSVHADERMVRVDVCDSGKGVSADEMLMIFEPFARGADSGAEGLGIGLALVRGLVELHGGSVAVRSDGPGRGSCFSVTLPRSGGGNTAHAGGANDPDR
jgi:signal transduction histidine kinase